MGLDLAQFRKWIVLPTLRYLEPEIPYSLAAERLVVGIAIHESRDLTYLDQLDPGVDDPGPAYGFYQMEEATYRDLWVNWLAYRTAIGGKLRALVAAAPEAIAQLRSNLTYATAVTRANLYRRTEKLPAADDLTGLASYAKRYHNSAIGKATVEDYLRGMRTAAEAQRA